MTYKKYYIVVNGREPGIYDDWEKTKKQVDKFRNSYQFSFKVGNDENVIVRAIYELRNKGYSVSQVNKLIWGNRDSANLDVNDPIDKAIGDLLEAEYNKDPKKNKDLIEDLAREFRLNDPEKNKDLIGDILKFTNKDSSNKVDSSSKMDSLLSLERPYNDAKNPNDDLNNDFYDAYENIVSSEEFRRLQDKTQLFPLAKSDYVRTRLTHSLEVSIIAKQLVSLIFDALSQLSDDEEEQSIVKLKEDWCKRQDKIENIVLCAGLLHDIGNPPFGHFGESAIGKWFSDKNIKNLIEGVKEDLEGKLNDEDWNNNEELNDAMKEDLRNFEGNAQGLRILTKNYYKPRGGDNCSRNKLNVPYSVISAMVKYPNLSTSDTDENKVYKHKMGVNQAEKEAFDCISKNVLNLDKKKSIEKGNIPRNQFAYIVEAADDIAYLVSDLQDAMRTGLVSLGEIKKELENLVEIKKEHENLVDVAGKGDIEQWGDSVRQAMKKAITKAFCDNYYKEKDGSIRNGTFTKSLLEASGLKELENIAKGLKKKYVYNAPLIIEPELSSVDVVNTLMGAFIRATVTYAFKYKTEYKKTVLDNSAEPREEARKKAREEAREKAKKCTDVQQRLIEKIPPMIIDDYDDWLEWFLDRDTKDHEDPKCTEYQETFYHGILIATDFISGMTDRQAMEMYRLLRP